MIEELILRSLLLDPDTKAFQEIMGI